MSCKCSKLDPDDGRYTCSVSGDGCTLIFPDDIACALTYGEGPLSDVPKEELEKRALKRLEKITDYVVPSEADKNPYDDDTSYDDDFYYDPE